MKCRINTWLLFASLELGLGLGLSNPVLAHPLQAHPAAKHSLAAKSQAGQNSLRMLVAADFDVFLPNLKNKPATAHQASACQHKRKSPTQHGRTAASTTKKIAISTN